MGVSNSKKLNLLVIGLDNAGKSTIIQRMKSKSNTYEIPPTPGFQIEKFKTGKLKLTVFDMSGDERYRSLWEFYFKETEAVVFVVDATDRNRMGKVHDEIAVLLENEEKKPFLLFANKMDLPGTMNISEISKILHLEEMQDRPWTVIATSALEGIGLDDGLTWIERQITK